MNTFNWPIRVYYEDTDAGGVVYHANYLKFFERARTEMLRSIGFEQDQLTCEHQLIFAVRSAHLDYLKPARFNDALIATSKITLVKKVSLNFEQTITHDNDILCKGNIRIASLNAVSMRPKVMPDNLLQKLI